jgi:GGDEF domain-containing protein
VSSPSATEQSPTRVLRRTATTGRDNEYAYGVTVAGIARIRHETMAVAIGLVVIGLGFIVDVTTGRDLSLSLVYVAGVGLMVWAGSARVGVLGAVGASVGVLRRHPELGRDRYRADERGGGLRTAPRHRGGRRLHARQDGAGSQPRSVHPLTGLSNRRACEERCAVEIARLHRRAGSLSVAFLDFDGLKQINDVRGHAAGDAALIHLAKSAQAVLRPTDLLSRVGGDEFVLCYPTPTTTKRPPSCAASRVVLPKPTGTCRRRSRRASSPGTACPRASRNCSSKPTPSCTAPSARAATTTSSPKSSAEPLGAEDREHLTHRARAPEPRARYRCRTGETPAAGPGEGAPRTTSS